MQRHIIILKYDAVLSKLLSAPLVAVSEGQQLIGFLKQVTTELISRRSLVVGEKYSTVLQ